MSIKNNVSIEKMLSQNRIQVYCFNCGSTYVTRLLNGDKNRPRRCKNCGSTRIDSIKRWRRII